MHINGIKEWAIIEVQGVLEFQPRDMKQLLGNLIWVGNTAYLIITHNILEGKEVQLENPLVVLSRGTDSDMNQTVAAIIRRKIIFKTRPKPLAFHASKFAL
uniref:Myosin motor domain-containing protein n=1 Tax=Syphacia muris TaxID=451379 RepID=A0A0N5AIC0_9BILA